VARKFQTQASSETSTKVGGLRVVSSPSISSPVVGGLDRVSAGLSVDDHTKPTRKIRSAESVAAQFDTLFDRFDLHVAATYSYYVAGEDDDAASNVSLGAVGDAPRKIVLRWKKVPKPHARCSVKPTEASAMSAELSFPSMAAVVRTPDRSVMFASLIDPSIDSVASMANAREVHQVESVGKVGSIGKAVGRRVASPKRVVAPLVPSRRKQEEGSASGYSGLVLQRESLVNGSFSLDWEKSLDVTASSYVDLDIVFGRPYRYRIKAIFTWFHASDVGLEKSAFSSRANAISQPVETFFSSRWSVWEQATIVDVVRPSPPDEIRATSDVDNGEVSVIWRFPYDPQLDVDGIVVYRKTVDAETLVDRERWSEVHRAGPSNGIFVDRGVKPTSENGDALYVYAAAAHTSHGELSRLSEQIAVGVYSRGEAVIRTQMVSSPGVEIDEFGNAGRIVRAKTQTPLVFKSGAEVSIVSGKRRGAQNPQVLLARFRSLSTGQTIDTSIEGEHVDVVVIGSSAAKRAV
jgi:hypothetical protein